MRHFYLIPLLAVSASCIAQSPIPVKMTSSDRGITVPRENFTGLSLGEAEDQNDEFPDEIYIVGYDDYDPMCGIHSMVWSNNTPGYLYTRVPYTTEWPAEETMTDVLATDGTNIYAAGMVQTNVVFDSGYRYEYAAVWRNWVATSILNDGYRDAYTPLSTCATDIAVDNNHVYITTAGNSESSSWTVDGVEYNIMDGRSVCCYNGDVYVARDKTVSLKHRTVLLKNGEVLTDTITGYISDLTVDANGIHYLKNSHLWSDGKIVETGISNPIGLKSENNILYVGGSGPGGLPSVWKNGETIPLISHESKADFRAFCVVDGRIYGVGSYNGHGEGNLPFTVPILYANGKEYNLNDYEMGCATIDIKDICAIRKQNDDETAGVRSLAAPKRSVRITGGCVEVSGALPGELCRVLRLDGTLERQGSADADGMARFDGLSSGVRIVSFKSESVKVVLP